MHRTAQFGTHYQKSSARKQKKGKYFLVSGETSEFTRFYDSEGLISLRPSLLQESHSGELQGDRRDREARAQGDRVPAGDRTGSPGKCKRPTAPTTTTHPCTHNRHRKSLPVHVGVGIHLVTHV